MNTLNTLLESNTAWAWSHVPGWSNFYRSLRLWLLKCRNFDPTLSFYNNPIFFCSEEIKRRESEKERPKLANPVTFFRYSVHSSILVVIGSGRIPKDIKAHVRPLNSESRPGLTNQAKVRRAHSTNKQNQVNKNARNPSLEAAAPNGAELQTNFGYAARVTPHKEKGLADETCTKLRKEGKTQKTQKTWALQNAQLAFYCFPLRWKRRGGSFRKEGASIGNRPKQDAARFFFGFVYLAFCSVPWLWAQSEGLA